MFRVSEAVPDAAVATGGIAVTSAPGTDGEYVAGDDIKVTVTFTRSVTVTGTPQIRLKTEAGRQWANYVASGSTATQLVFVYQVGAGDYDHDGIGVLANTLKANGGTITDTASGADANLSHGALADQAAHKVHVAPRIASEVSLGSPPDDGVSFVTGETIRFAVTFDRDVRVVTDGGTPQYTFQLNAADREAAYTAMSGDRILYFDYEVAGDDYGARFSAADPALDENGGVITRKEVDATIAGELAGPTFGGSYFLGAGAYPVNAGRPVIAAGGITLTSTPNASAGTYGEGETIEASVRFSKSVTVDTTSGSPELVMRLQSAGESEFEEERLVYDRGSASNTLVFQYTVQAEDRDDDGLAIASNAIRLRSGTIRDSDGTDAFLEHASIADLADHKVDGNLLPAGVPGVQLSTLELSVDEGGSNTYGVRLNTEPTGTVTVTPGASGSTDVTVTPSTLTFTTANWDTQQTVTVMAAQDADGDDDSAIVTHAVSGADYASVVAKDLAVAVVDDETASTEATLSLSPALIAEDAGATSVTVTATLDQAPRGADTALTIAIGASGDTAADGTDYASVNDFTLTIAAGQTTGTGTFTFTPTDDSTQEVPETVTVTAAGSGLTVTGAQLTITDDETASTSLTLTTNAASVAEGDGATTVTVTATLDGTALSASTDVTVSVGASADAATEGTDYASVSDFTLTIAAGQTTAEGTFTLTPTDDNVDEGDEALTVGGTAALTVNGTSVTIADDDTRGVELSTAAPHADGGRQRHIHGGAAVGAHRLGDRDAGGERRRRRDGLAGGADLHRHDLGQRADGDGLGRARYRRRGRLGDCAAHRGGRRLRLRSCRRGGGDGQRRRNGA